MGTIIIGEAIVIGGNINTDQIYLGRFLALTDPEEIENHCLSGVGENIAASFPKGGIVAIRANSGRGSSREHAPTALLHMGVSTVVADSFARIFSRNSINLGLPSAVCRGIGKKMKYRQTLKLDLESGTITVTGTGECWLCEKMGEQAFKISEAGGIRLMMRGRMKKGGK